jgi:imidazolonepropionase-like amidohydrolase
MSADPALEARYARNGSILYLSTGGFRLRAPDGNISAIDWPLRYRTPVAPEPLLIRGARVIDGRGTPLSSPSDVLIREGRIVQVSTAGAIPAGRLRVIDAKDAYLVPGFIDLHSHLWDDLAIPGLLHNGVTTVRDIASQTLRTPDTRNRIEAGIIDGPRVVYGGAMFHRMGAGFSSLGDQATTDSGSIARALAILAGLDARFVKERGFEGWSSAVRLVSEAHRFGMTVSGHCEHILPVIAAGIDGAEHVLDCFRDRYALRSDLTELARAAGLFVVPTAALYFSMLQGMDDSALVTAPDVAPFIPSTYRSLYVAAPANERNRASFTTRVRRMRQGVGAYHASGVTVATGTDSPFPLGLQHEMEMLVASGMTPMQAIVAATGGAARVLNAPEIGTIAEGQFADLLLLTANPLDDIRNTRQIRHVIQGGRIIDREALRRIGLP